MLVSAASWEALNGWYSSTVSIPRTCFFEGQTEQAKKPRILMQPLQLNVYDSSNKRVVQLRLCKVGRPDVTDGRSGAVTLLAHWRQQEQTRAALRLPPLGAASCICRGAGCLHPCRVVPLLLTPPTVVAARARVWTHTQTETAGELKRKACRALGVAEDKVALWDFFHREKHNTLENKLHLRLHVSNGLRQSGGGGGGGNGGGVCRRQGQRALRLS